MNAKNCGNGHMEKNISKTEPHYNIKHGGYWLAERGLTTQQKYARKYYTAEAEAVKKFMAKKNTLVELVEVDQ
jgi:hypothetical protein